MAPSRASDAGSTSSADAERHFIESSGAIHGPPDADQPGPLWNPSATPTRFASAIAKAKRSSHSGDIVAAVAGRFDIRGAKTQASAMPAAAIASRSRVMPSRVTQSSSQCHQHCRAHEAGGSRKPSCTAHPAAPSGSAAAAIAAAARSGRTMERILMVLVLRYGRSAANRRCRSLSP